MTNFTRVLQPIPLRLKWKEITFNGSDWWHHRLASTIHYLQGFLFTTNDSCTPCVPMFDIVIVPSFQSRSFKIVSEWVSDACNTNQIGTTINSQLNFLFCCRLRCFFLQKHSVNNKRKTSTDNLPHDLKWVGNSSIDIERTAFGGM